MIIVCSLFCVIGIYLGRYIDISSELFLLGLLIVLLGKKKSLAFTLGISLMFCAIGIYRGAMQYDGYESLRRVFETKTTVVGRSLDDAEYDSRGQLAFSMNSVEINGEKIPGQIAVGGFGEVGVLRGDLVEVTGKVFPARGSNQARVSFAQLDVIEHDSQWYNSLRRKLNKRLRDNLPEPLSSFAGGLLIGQKSTIPDSVISNLRISGLSHIIAVSGYNLTIIVRFVMRALKRLSRYQKLMISFSIITVFLLITGFSASIVRAAIVCGLSLLAWYYGRNFRPAVLLGVSALITTFYRPEYVWGDAGWYLSFLAFTGILLVSPIIKQRIYKDKQPKLIGSLMVETTSVLIMVTPYSLYLFGTLSLVALVANLLVVPLIPLAMALSAVTIFTPASLAVLTTPANAVLSVILELARITASIPNASLAVHITLLEMYVIYVCSAVVFFLMWNTTRKRLEGNILVQ
jgi:ComEC/Rec2-related protein